MSQMQKQLLRATICPLNFSTVKDLSRNHKKTPALRLGVTDIQMCIRNCEIL